MNHVVPLCPITPDDAESNTCEVGAGCKNYVNNFPDCQKLQLVACKYSFRKFHLQCCALDNAHITEREWDCKCYVKRDTLTRFDFNKSLDFFSLAKLTSTSEVQLCLQQHNSAIKEYITNISKDKVYSPYMGLFKFKHKNALRDLAIERFQFGTNLRETRGEESPDDVITDYAMRIGMQLSKFKGISLSDRVTLNINVLAPEMDEARYYKCQHTLEKSNTILLTISIIDIGMHPKAVQYRRANRSTVYTHNYFMSSAEIPTPTT
eukprot:gene16430-18066_t